jgi:hypothetical protein
MGLIDLSSIKVINEVIRDRVLLRKISTNKA